jgi:hypothetical protein
MRTLPFWRYDNYLYQYNDLQHRTKKALRNEQLQDMKCYRFLCISNALRECTCTQIIMCCMNLWFRRECPSPIVSATVIIKLGCARITWCFIIYGSFSLEALPIPVLSFEWLEVNLKDRILNDSSAMYDDPFLYSTLFHVLYLHFESIFLQEDGELLRPMDVMLSDRWPLFEYTLWNMTSLWHNTWQYLQKCKILLNFEPKGHKLFCFSF